VDGMTSIPTRQIDDIEVVDLEAMTLEELVAEKVAVNDEVRSIQAQLMDATRRPETTEDDSPEWGVYRDWRRRARWALVYRRREADDITVLLVQRQQERAEENQRRKAEAVMLAPESACHTPEEYATLRASATERRQSLLAALTADGAADALVLRLYRAVRHLIGHGDGLPEELDADDRSALSEAAIFLRSRFTSSGVRNFVDGRLSDYRP
jgi:hypothetical protein